MVQATYLPRHLDLMVSLERWMHALSTMIVCHSLVAAATAMGHRHRFHHIVRLTLRLCVATIRLITVTETAK